MLWVWRQTRTFQHSPSNAIHVTHTQNTEKYEEKQYKLFNTMGAWDRYSALQNTYYLSFFRFSSFLFVQIAVMGVRRQTRTLHHSPSTTLHLKRSQNTTVCLFFRFLHFPFTVLQCRRYRNKLKDFNTLPATPYTSHDLKTQRNTSKNNANSSETMGTWDMVMAHQNTHDRLFVCFSDFFLSLSFV